MTEKVEWEVIDESASTARPSAGAPRKSLEQMLGRWWRWKIGALLALAALALMMLIAVAGVVALSIAAVALLSLGAARVMRWIRGTQTHPLATRPPR